MNVTALYTRYLVELTDPRTTPWPLTNLSSVVAILAVYLYVVLKAGPDFMRHRRPFSLKRVIQFYNVFQVACCALLIHKYMAHGWQTHFYPFTCHAIDYSDSPSAMHMAEAVWWTMVLKCIELIETVFFVLRKKFSQITVLHLYHHTSTFLLAWVGTVYVAGGSIGIPVVLNSFVHIVMYTYYFLSTLGPSWQRRLAKWKPRLTLLQMIQFGMILTQLPTFVRDDCDYPRLVVYVFIPDVLIVFYMFYDFYKKYTVAKED